MTKAKTPEEMAEEYADLEFAKPNNKQNRAIDGEMYSCERDYLAGFRASQSLQAEKLKRAVGFGFERGFSCGLRYENEYDVAVEIASDQFLESEAKFKGGEGEK